jgi:hypothetical protein
MFKKWTSFLLMFLVFNLVAGRVALAQVTADKQARTTAKVKEKVAKIGRDNKITVRRYDKTEVTGYLSAIDSDSFTLTDKINRTTTSFSYAEVNKVSRDGSSKALTIGVIAGLAAGATVLLVILGKRICNERAC